MTEPGKEDEKESLDVCSGCKGPVDDEGDCMDDTCPECPDYEVEIDVDDDDDDEEEVE